MHVGQYTFKVQNCTVKVCFNSVSVIFKFHKQECGCTFVLKIFGSHQEEFVRTWRAVLILDQDVVAADTK
jgi:hypothetical protein